MSFHKLSFVAISLFAVAGTSSAFSAGFFENSLPAWPINSVGEEISSSLINSWRKLGDTCRIPGTTKYFPAKGRGTNDENKLDDAEKLEKKLDPQGFNCDDGDMTMFNGLLCASGEKSGCAAVKYAQDSKGRFFRSPHRMWVWQVRCFDKVNPSFGSVFQSRCANGFSPDMNLGVLLYTLATHDIRNYSRWINWINENAKTTQLCRLDEKNQPYDCIRTEWPRVCPVDLGYSKPSIKIDGRQGGNCVLRPPDALDFDAVNDALGVSMPDAMNTFKVSSRILLKGAIGTVSGGILSDVPPLLLMSLFEKNKDPSFPMHLDGVRVLIRMMIRNPSMRLNNLPDLPTPEDFVNNITQIGASDGTDVATIALAAKVIAQRAPWNPFFRLLSEGPTNSVRSLVMEHCPAQGTKSERHYWLWEVPEEQAVASESMGWDCVFVAELYNKMRVKKNILDELMDWALKLADGLGTSLTIASRGLDLAQAGSALAHKALDQSERDLKYANEFVADGYSTAKQAGRKKIREIQNKISDLAQKSVDLQKKINDLGADLATRPLTVAMNVANKVCKWDPTGVLCWIEHKVEDVANPAIDELKGKIREANNALADIQQNQITAANEALAQTEDQISALDDKMQAVQQKLASGVLQVSFDLARTHMEFENKLLQHARDRVVELKRADLKLQNYIKTWTGKGTQDTQIPNITDADLEHDRPTPEVAQSTICLPALGESTSDDAATALQQIVAPLYDGTMLGSPLDYAQVNPSRLLLVPSVIQIRIAAHDINLSPCAGKSLTRTLYYREHQVFATELASLGTTNSPLKDEKTTWCGTETLRFAFDQITLNPVFAKAKKDISTTNQTHLKISEKGSVLSYMNTVSTNKGITTCVERLLLVSDLTPAS